MSTFAKVIAVIILIIGLVVMLGGLGAGLGGALRAARGFGYVPMPGFPGFNMPMMGVVGINLVIGAALFIQGLLLFGFGLVIYLVADIARRLEVSPPR